MLLALIHGSVKLFFEIAIFLHLSTPACNGQVRCPFAQHEQRKRKRGNHMDRKTVKKVASMFFRVLRFHREESHDCSQVSHQKDGIEHLKLTKQGQTDPKP